MIYYRIKTRPEPDRPPVILSIGALPGTEFLLIDFLVNKFHLTGFSPSSPLRWATIDVEERGEIQPREWKQLPSGDFLSLEKSEREGNVFYSISYDSVRFTDSVIRSIRRLSEGRKKSVGLC